MELRITFKIYLTSKMRCDPQPVASAVVTAEALCPALGLHYSTSHNPDTRNIGRSFLVNIA